MSLAQVFGLISLDEEDSKISIKWNYPKRSKWSWMLGHLKREKLTHPYKILLWVDCIHSTNIDQDMFIWTIEENVASIWVHNPYNDKCDFFFFFLNQCEKYFEKSNKCVNLVHAYSDGTLWLMEIYDLCCSSAL